MLKKIVLIVSLTLFLSGCTVNETEENISETKRELVYNENDSLLVPTAINKIDDTYYIVDCYNNNILYNDSLDQNLKNWYKIPEPFNQPHMVIGDGRFFIVIDTENNRLVTFLKEGDFFVKQEDFWGFGNRPHYGSYTNGLYYIWDGVSNMYEMKEKDGKLKVENIYTIPSLNGQYVRSFTYEDNQWYFPTSGGKIVVTNEKFEVTHEYNVPVDIAGLSYIYKVGEHWYINIFTDINYDTSYSNLVRCKELGDLEDEEYETLYDDFGLESAPYYVSYFDNAYYMAALNGKSAIYRLDVDNEIIVECTQIY